MLVFHSCCPRKILQLTGRNKQPQMLIDSEILWWHGRVDDIFQVKIQGLDFSFDDELLTSYGGTDDCKLVIWRTKTGHRSINQSPFRMDEIVSSSSKLILNSMKEIDDSLLNVQLNMVHCRKFCRGSHLRKPDATGLRHLCQMGQQHSQHPHHNGRHETQRVESGRREPEALPRLLRHRKTKTRQPVRGMHRHNLPFKTSLPFHHFAATSSAIATAA